jgi:DNA damage-binding protein 1
LVKELFLTKFVFVLSGQSNEEERRCLQNYGCIHIGEQINVFRHGSFGMQQSNELFASHFQGMIIAGTVSGAIMIFSQLSNTMFKILSELQARLAKHIVTAGIVNFILFSIKFFYISNLRKGKISYDKWRLYESDRRSDGYKYFIDGDLIESYLDLSPAEAANIVKDFKVNFFFRLFFTRIKINNYFRLKTQTKNLLQVILVN